jgi:hypothetical protein
MHIALSYSNACTGYTEQVIQAKEALGDCKITKLDLETENKLAKVKDLPLTKIEFTCSLSKRSLSVLKLNSTSSHLTHLIHLTMSKYDQGKMQINQVSQFLYCIPYAPKL